jgi:hypothetical protein
MAQQTLKSLLGLSDKRKQVDLDLDQQVFQAPSVEAGRYRVAPPRYSKTNAATNIANALGRYAGPIAKQLGGIEDERQQEYANIAEGTPTEILQAIQKGKLDPVQDQLNEYSSKLDEAERKKLLNFSENPNNYIRASRVVGDRLANQYQADLRENQELYAAKRDENGDLIPARDQMQQVRDELIKENNLTGYSLRSFIESTAQFETEEELRINTRQDAIFKSQVRQDTKASMVGAIKVGLTDDTQKTFRDNWVTQTQNMTVDEQITFLTEVVTDAASVDRIATEKFVSLLTEDDALLTLGSGSELDDALKDTLGDILDEQQKADERAIADKVKIAQSALTKTLVDASLTLQEGGNLGVVELVQIDSDETIEVDLTSVTNQVELYTAIKDGYVNANPDATTRTGLIAELSQNIENINNAQYSFNNDVGIDKIRADLNERFSEQIVVGNTSENVYGLNNTEIVAKVDSYTAELETQLESIYNDPTIGEAEKKKQASLLVQQTQRTIDDKVRADSQEFVTTRNTLKFENSVGLSATNNSYTTSIISSLQANDPISGLPAMSGSEALAITKPFVEETRESMRAILNAPLTDEELSSGNLAQIYANRQLAARDYLLESQEIFISETRNPAEEEEEEASTVTTEETETVEPRTLNTSGNYTPTGGRGREARDKNGRYSNNVRAYEQRNQQASENGHGDYLAEIRALAASDAEKQKTSTIKLSRASFYRKNGFRDYYIRESYNHAATERLYEDNPAITIDELESGTLNGFRLGQVDVTKTVVLSPSMVINAEDNRELLTEYAVALGLDTDDNTLNTFIQTQASLMESRFSLNIYND